MLFRTALGNGPICCDIIKSNGWNRNAIRSVWNGCWGILIGFYYSNMACGAQHTWHTKYSHFNWNLPYLLWLEAIYQNALLSPGHPEKWRPHEITAQLSLRQLCLKVINWTSSVFVPSINVQDTGDNKFLFVVCSLLVPYTNDTIILPGNSSRFFFVTKMKSAIQLELCVNKTKLQRQLNTLCLSSLICRKHARLTAVVISLPRK